MFRNTPVGSLHGFITCPLVSERRKGGGEREGERIKEGCGARKGREGEGRKEGRKEERRGGGGR